MVRPQKHVLLKFFRRYGSSRPCKWSVLGTVINLLFFWATQWAV
jgi:hypothetical protein